MTDLWYGTSGRRDASIAIVGESWGVQEEQAKAPFVGQSGQELTRMLADAGISRDDCFLTNVVAARPPENDMRKFFVPQKEAKAYAPIRGLCPAPMVRNGLESLHAQLQAVSPRVIVALGNYALWALTNSSFSVSTKEGWKVPSGITSWRGSYLEYETAPRREKSIPVVPTYHPAAVLRQWDWRAVAVQDLRARVAPIAKGGVVPPDHTRFITRPSFGQVINTLDMLAALSEGSWLTCDVETHAGHIDCIGLAWSDTDAICIPLFSIFTGAAYWSLIQEQMIHARLRKLFRQKHLLWTGQNYSYDFQYLDASLYNPPRPDFDTMAGHHLAFPGTPKSLDYLSSIYCRHHRYWGESSDHSTDDERWRYNCYDTCKTWEITGVLQGVHIGLGLVEQMQERMDIMYEVAFDMMRRGVRIDIPLRRKLTLEMVDEIALLERWVDSLMPDHLRPLIAGKTSKSPWYRSPTQQAKFFYDLCGIPPVLNPKTKRPTVDDDALPKIKLMQPLLAPMVDALQDLRTLGIYYNQVTAKLEPNGRMGTSFNTAGPVSFRWSSSENAFGRGTNLQNIAKEKDT